MKCNIRFYKNTMHLFCKCVKMIVPEKKPKLVKIKKYFTEFSDNTTIHGFKYLVDGKTFLIQKYVFF